MKKREKKSPKGMGLMAFFRTLPKYKLPWLVIIAAFLFNVAFNQLLLKLPTTTADLLSGSMEGAALWKAIRYYLVFAVLASCQTYILCVTENFSVYRSRKSLWRRMLRNKVKYYDDNNPSEMMSAVTNDLYTAMGFLANTIVFILPDIIYLVQAMFKISEYHISLTLAEFSILPLKYIYMVVLGRWVSTATMKMYDRIGGLTGYLAERINHLTHVKTFTNEAKELTNGAEASTKLYKAKMELAKFDCVNNGVSILIQVIEKIVVMLAAVILLQKGIITIQQWVAFFMFSTEISMKFDMFVAAWMKLKQVQGSVARSVDMMNAEEEKVGRAEEGEDVIKAGKTDVEFEHVTFAYGDHVALKDVSFSVPAGTSVCIVGLCGSGKTTALNLLERFYDLKSGAIRLGGDSIADMPLSAYRRRFGYVQQGADIFTGTVREAMTYGIAREVTDEELMKAAELSGFDKYLKEQPKGLDTYLHMGSDSLSGGQNQRLVLAREFLRGAEIVLMDEPTSALDVETAKKIRRMIQSLFEGKTKIVVSHDLELARDMDRIVVLENGVCVGNGTYEELLGNCSLFAEMVAAHNQEKEAAE